MVYQSVPTTWTLPLSDMYGILFDRLLLVESYDSLVSWDYLGF